ncbi:MAG: diguanylate cyclase [Nitrosospira sp.]
MKILIAEDDTPSRLVFGAILRKLGHAVTAVADGREAWKAWQQNDYPLVISDWMMPDIDGLELCKMIRAEHSLQYTYIILLTSMDGKGSYLEGMKAGADDFITKPFDEEYLATRLHVAERILALHKTLHLQATHDFLTGLWNRGAIMDNLQKELVRAERWRTPISVIMVDLDHFKQVNDTYGHSTGDALLCEAASRICALLRPSDRAGRYGGEEFLIIIPNCARDDALNLAERIRRSISEKPVDIESESIFMTISLGVATHGGEDAATLIGVADKALYRAKKAGRNRVEFSD